jgi:WD40 repeat protein
MKLFYVDVNTQDSNILHLGQGYFFTQETQPYTEPVHSVDILLLKNIIVWDYLQQQTLSDTNSQFTKPLLSLELLADHYKREGEFTYQLFRDSVRCIKCTNDLLIVVQEKKILLHDLATKKIVWRETFENYFGACDVSCGARTMVAYPNTTQGSITIENVTDSSSIVIQAHTSRICRVALNCDGTLVATASIKGTLVRIFDTATGNKIREVRRGSTMATIYCIAFNVTSSLLCCTSDTGTLHIWDITENGVNRSSNLSFVNYVVDVQYTASEWSVSEHRGLHCPSLCIFDKDDVRVISQDGTCKIMRLENRELVVVDTYDLLLKFVDLDDAHGWSLL